ncbi:MAG: hypothetical protein OES90_12030 [Xanthomonadales bacterium]|nr:hypothetical protein [Xanthomonadales bacterium]
MRRGTRREASLGCQELVERVPWGMNGTPWAQGCPRHTPSKNDVK